MRLFLSRLSGLVSSVLSGFVQRRRYLRKQLDLPPVGWRKATGGKIRLFSQATNASSFPGPFPYPAPLLMLPFQIKRQKTHDVLWQSTTNEFMRMVNVT